jgi:hypothetical protein
MKLMKVLMSETDVITEEPQEKPMEAAEKYIREALALFVRDDPPDTAHQEGYLEALLAVAVEGLGISGADPEILAAANCTPNAVGFDPSLAKKLKLTVIEGGKE